MFSQGNEVLVLIEGSLIKGEVVAVAKDDEGTSAYEVKAPNNALGAHAKWFKGSDVFMLEKSEEEKLKDWQNLAAAVVGQNFNR